MIVKNIIDNCSVFNVAKTIAYWAKVDDKDFPDLLQRCTKLFDELKEIDDYWVCDDKNFCFVGYKADNEQFPEVVLVDLDKLEANGFDIDAVTSFDWYWGVIFGLSVYEKSVEEYGVDMLLGRILYRVTYYDYTETEIAPLRKKIEESDNFAGMNQTEFYIKLMTEVFEWKESLYK